MIIAIATEGDDRLDAILDPVRDSTIALPAAHAAPRAGRHRDPAAAARVPRRRAPRHRRRPAAQPRQERDGRMNGGSAARPSVPGAAPWTHSTGSTPSSVPPSSGPKGRSSSWPAPGLARRARSPIASRTSSARASRRSARCSPSPSRTRRPRRCGSASPASSATTSAASGSRRSTRCAPSCCAARGRRSASTATSSSTTRPTSRPRSSRRSRTSTPTTS